MLKAKHTSWAAWVAALGVIVALGWHGFWASQNWTSVGMGGHEFRQTQTALGVQAMKEDGFRMDYSTPVLGKPWSIPMEFPLYQGVVSVLSNTTDMPIAQAGRWVSLVCFWLTLPALLLLGREAGFSRAASGLALIPVILSPVYMLFARAVLIESMALAAAAWFLVGVLRYRRQPNGAVLAFTLLVGIAAVLIKPTTWSAFCVPWAILWVRDAWRGWRQRQWPAGIAEQALLIGVPLLGVGIGWVWIADQIKMLNPNAYFLISTSIAEFNYGTWSQRATLENWQIILEHCRTNVGPLTLIGAGLVLMLGQRTSRAVGLIAALTFGVMPLIFFGLYLLHDYYFYANAAFLGLAIGSGAAALWDRPSRGGWTKVLALGLLLVLGVGQFRNHQAKLLPQQLQTSNGESAEVLLVRALTEPDEVVIIHSEGWSSELPYFSHRRFLTIPDFQMFFRPEKVYQAVAALADEKVTLMFVRDQARKQPDWIAERVKQLGFMNEPFAELDDRVTVYTARKYFDSYREIMKRVLIPGWEISELQGSPAAAPITERQPIDSTLWPESMEIIGPRPAMGVLPYGLGPLEYEDAYYVIVHGGSELYFRVPEDATGFTGEFLINPTSYDQPNWDGIEVMIEGVTATEKPTYLAGELIKPQDFRHPRTLTASWETAEYKYIRVRVLPGLRNSYSYDHAWFSKLSFD